MERIGERGVGLREARVERDRAAEHLLGRGVLLCGVMVPVPETSYCQKLCMG